MTRRQLLLVFSFLLTGVIVYAAARDEWGRPLGPRYSGPEVQPRQVALQDLILILMISGLTYPVAWTFDAHDGGELCLKWLDWQS